MPITKMEQEPSLIQASNPETAHREHDYPQHDEQQSNSPSKHSHAQYHNIQHRRLRGRQAESINSALAKSAIPSVVTELIQTISIIQQINVDEQGNTIGVTTYTTSDEPLTTANFIASSEMPSSASSDTIASSSLPVSDELPAVTGSVVPTASAEPLPTTSDLPASAPVSATPFELPATVSAPETFASLIPSINATLIVSSSSLTTFLSSTTSASSSSSSSTTSTISIDSLLSSLPSTNSGSFTLNAKVGSSSSSIETTSSTSSAVSYTYSQAYPSTTSGGDFIAGGGTVGAPNAPLSGDSSSSNDASNDDGPAPLDPPKIAGAVVGGLAGLAALLILAFYILRHMKQKRGGAVRLSASSLSPGLIGGGAAASSPMSEKRSPGRFLPIYNAFRTRTNPKQLGSSQAAQSNEPSFVRISGRKLPSVLQHGGDGYGGPGEVPPIPQHLSQQLNDASFYADDTGYHGGTGDKGVSTAVAGGALAATAAGQREKRSATPSTQNQPSTPLRHPDIRNPFTSPDDSILPAPRSDAGAPLCRDGAWRSALVSQTDHGMQRHKSHKAHLSSGLSSSPEQPHTGNTETSGSTNYTDAREYESLDNMVLRRPDPLGRSHPSQDGSKGSRFREDV